MFQSSGSTPKVWDNICFRWAGNSDHGRPQMAPLKVDIVIALSIGVYTTAALDGWKLTCVSLYWGRARVGFQPSQSSLGTLIQPHRPQESLAGLFIVPTRPLLLIRLPWDPLPQLNGMDDPSLAPGQVRWELSLNGCNRVLALWFRLRYRSLFINSTHLGHSN